MTSGLSNYSNQLRKDESSPHFVRELLKEDASSAAREEICFLEKALAENNAQIAVIGAGFAFQPATGIEAVEYIAAGY